LHNRHLELIRHSSSFPRHRRGETGTSNFLLSKWLVLKRPLLAGFQRPLTGGNTTAVYTTEPLQYGELISQRRGSNTIYYHFDAEGSTRQLTDPSGNITDAYTYSAYGENVLCSGSTLNEFQFGGAIGYHSGSLTSDLYIRARDYSPALGRWLTIDPRANSVYSSLLYAEQFVDMVPAGAFGSALYEYCGSQPISCYDPGGEEEEHRCGRRESNRETHQRGKARKQKDRGGEKGDARRGVGRKRPQGRKGPWPPKKGSIKFSVVKYLYLLSCEVACAYAYQDCLDESIEDYELCLQGAYQRHASTRQQQIALCDSIYALDNTECAATYAACGLTCLLPISFAVSE
jgi:RHS repeat-associated protein